MECLGQNLTNTAEVCHALMLAAFAAIPDRTVFKSGKFSKNASQAECLAAFVVAQSTVATFMKT